MNNSKNDTKEPAKSSVPANQPIEKRGHEKPNEGQANTTGAQPGMPQRNEQGKPMTGPDERNKHASPNPGPGVTSQGHRVDEDTPAHANEQDADQKQHTAKHDMPSKDKPRDQDKDRKEPLDEHQAGNKMPEKAVKTTH